MTKAWQTEEVLAAQARVANIIIKKTGTLNVGLEDWALIDALCETVASRPAPLPDTRCGMGRLLTDTEGNEAAELYARLCKQDDPYALTRTIEHFRPFCRSSAPVLTQGKAGTEKVPVGFEQEAADLAWLTQEIAEEKERTHKKLARAGHGQDNNTIVVVSNPWCERLERIYAICKNAYEEARLEIQGY